MTCASPDVSDLRCWANIDLAAIKHNAGVCRDLAGEGCGVMAIVKADAYGHGLERIAKALADEVAWFGVANRLEAIRARDASSPAMPILILSPATSDEIPAIVADGFSASVSSVEEVEAYAAAARNAGTTAKLHAVADTGMGRMGALPDQFPSLVEAITQNRHCELKGVETHFPSADEDAAFTRSQIDSFSHLIRSLELPDHCQVHLGNSAGLLGFPREAAFATLTRPGLALYGVSPLAGEGAALKPVLSLKTRVALVREIPAGTSISYGRTFIADHPMRTATLGVGYGDGYPRHLSGRNAEVLLAGQRCPLLGRVTMDQIVIDISHLEKPVTSGDEATLIGRCGEDEITASELAASAGTIPWEILTGITSRVVRLYDEASPY